MSPYLLIITERSVFKKTIVVKLVHLLLTTTATPPAPPPPPPPPNTHTPIPFGILPKNGIGKSLKYTQCKAIICNEKTTCKIEQHVNCFNTFAANRKKDADDWKCIFIRTCFFVLYNVCLQSTITLVIIAIIDRCSTLLMLL